MDSANSFGDSDSVEHADSHPDSIAHSLDYPDADANARPDAIRDGVTGGLNGIKLRRECRLEYA